MKNTTNFEHIFRAISTPCVALRPEKGQFIIVDANDAYLKITGSRREDMVGKTSCEAFPNNPSADSYGADILLDSFKKVTSQKQKDQMSILRYDIPVRGTEEFLEKYWDFENVPALNREGELEYILHTVKDVTDQVKTKKKEQKIRTELDESRRQFRHFVAANPDGLYSLDREGNFINSNQGLADIAEVPLGQLLKMNFLPFCSAEDKDYILERFGRAIAGEANKFEAKFISGKGRNMILEISLAPIINHGEVVGAYGIAKDRTRLRNSEDLIVKKRNYLQANAAFISSLLQKGFLDSSLQEPLTLIGEALDVDRIYYFASHPHPQTGETLLSIKREWTNAHAEPQIMQPELQNLPVMGIEELIKEPLKNRPFIANTEELQEGELKEKLRSQNTKSLLVMPIFLQDKLYGLVGFNDCVRERYWSTDEIDFLKTLAANLTSAFEKQAAREALKKQEKALRLSEQKFKALVQAGSDLIAILDLEGNYKFVSDTSTAVLGMKSWEYLGRNAFEFIHPDDQEYIMKQYSSLDIIKQFKLSPYRFRNKEGEWRWLETTLTNMTDDPAVQGVVGNSRDITQLVLQRQEIKQLNERYKLAATATQDLMYDWDLETDKVVRFHKNGSDFLGHSIEKVDQRGFWGEHIHPEELSELGELQEEILKDKEQDFIHAEYRFRRADGSYAHIIDSAFIIRNSKGKAVRMVGATSDISDLKAKEEALKIANKRFKLAMKATKEVIWDWDLTTGKVERSKTFEKISGYNLKKDSKQPNFWFSKIHPEDRERAELSLKAAVEQGHKRKWREEYRMIKANGEIAHMVDRGFIVRDQKGKAIRMVGSALDATKSRTAMKRIKHQNELLRDIAWDQSHLVRAPLTRLLGLLDLFEMEEFEEMSREDFLHHIRNSALEIDEIIRRIVAKTNKLEKEEKIRIQKPQSLKVSSRHSKSVPPRNG